MARVLILDGTQRSALAATRSLGKRVEAVVAAEETPCLAGRSRFASAALSYPPPARRPEEFQAWLAAECQRGGYEMVLPLTDATVPLVLARREEIEPWAALPFVDLATYELASDKRRLLELAASLGVPVPRSLFHEPGHPLEAHELRFPVVVKPQISKTWLGGRLFEAGAAHARTPEELARLLGSHPALSRVPVLIQERIEGVGVGLFALCQEGRPVRLFAHRRLLEKPPTGGVSVLCESVAIEPAVRECGLRLLEALGWHGVAMVEFRREQRTGTSYLMEINARFWGSLQLAIDCGLDFPADLYRMALGERLTPSEHYQVGRRGRWLLGCLDHYYLRLKTSLPIFGHMPGNGAVPPRAAQPTCDFVWRREDPAPFLWELKSWVAQALRRR